jgi:DEAD/DEAH box helicase domain-containing protein
VQYHVDKLDWGERKAYVRRVDIDYYTYANRAVTLKPLDVFASEPAAGGRRVHGEVMVASLVTLFKKLKFGTDENVGWGPIDLPEIELQTTAYWLTAEDAAVGWRRDDLDVALMGAGRAIQAVAAVLLMVDPRDLGLVTQVRSPHQESPTIYLYEAVPGGIGLSERLFARHEELVTGALELIEACGCDSGCPACTGPRLDPEVDAKALALRLLGALAGRAAIRADRGVAASGDSAHVPGSTLAEAAPGRLALDEPDGPRGTPRTPAHDTAEELIESGPRVRTQIGRP